MGYQIKVQKHNPVYKNGKAGEEVTDYNIVGFNTEKAAEKFINETAKTKRRHGGTVKRQGNVIYIYMKFKIQDLYNNKEYQEFYVYTIEKT